jgi:HK97 family phage major capsid protein
MTTKCGILYREGEVLKRAEDDDSRVVSVAFSSETAVERYFGTEILDHAPGSVRLGRLQNKGPGLVDHDRTDQVAVIESVSIDGDRRGRAALRFSKSVRGDEIFNDVVDGVRAHVSVGYRVHEWTEDKEGNVRVTDWEPMEISFVSIPADVATGVGRDEGSEENDVITHRTIEETIMSEDKKPAPTVDTKEIERKAAATARKDEQSRIREITALGKRNEADSLAEKYVESGKPLDEYRIELIDVMEKRRTEEAEKRKAEAKPATLLGMDNGDVKRYSLMSAIRASSSGNWKEAGFEKECSDKISEEMGREAQGFFIPLDVQMGKRVMNVGAATNPGGLGPENVGSDLVGTDHLAGSFIEFLYTQSVLFGAGATTLQGLVGNVDIPKQAGTTAFTWLDEDDDGVDDDVATGSVPLAPTTIAGAVPMTRRLMKQSSPSVEGMVMADLARGAALSIDLAAIQGTGTGPIPTGVMAQTGVSVVTITAGAPTWAQMVEFESTLDAADAANGNMSYITTPATIGYLKTTPKESGQAIYLMDSDRRAGVSAGLSGMCNGYDVRRRTGLTANTLVFGNWADVLIGMWGVLDVMADTATKAASGGLVLRVFQDVDVAIRHSASFAKANLV